MGRAIVFIVVLILGGCNSEPSPVQSPDDELDSFEFPSDIDVQLVASEPMVQDPVVIKFDEDGRLWVVEMRGFMQDIDGTGETDKVGRISILEDTDGDGTMDHSTIYIDSLIMPRALAILKGGALIAEDEKLWLAQDLNHDLRADTKLLIDSTYAGSSLPEHSGNGLWRGIDSWYYNVKSSLRYRDENGNWIRDSTEFRGQWGLSHDDEGRLIYNYNWSQLHADLVPPNYLSGNKNHTPTTGVDYGLTTDRRIYPIRSNLAVNRGYVTGTLDGDDRLLEFTAACSPFYYRGNILPKKYYGNVFVCEPSGNLIKRNVVKENGYYLSAYDPTPGKEFLASTDERFRPVSFASGPDGALYVADMYRGLIQHGKYITEYLREQTLSRKLDKPVHCGRIWRIVPRKWKASKPEASSKASSDKLIDNLSSTNGWIRDTSQRLLIERNDPNSIKSLEYTVLDNPNPLARFHALWTLYGMQALKGGDWPVHATNDTSDLVSANSFRLLELLSVNDVVVRLKLEIALFEKIRTANDKLMLQLALSSRIISPERRIDLLTSIITRYDSSALMRDVVLSGLQNNEWAFFKRLLRESNWDIKNPGKEIFVEMLTTSIFKNGNANELMSLLAQLQASPNDWQSKSILIGLTTQIKKGGDPIPLKEKPEAILKDAQNNSVVIDLVNTMFEWPGHKPTVQAAQSNSLNDAERKQFADGRQQYLTTCAGCHGTNGEGVSRFAPTLVQSEWVLSNVKKLTLIVLQGIEGPIDVNGVRYDVPSILPIMPAHTPLDDGTIANILTYIRNAWGNSATAISPRMVGVTRNRSQGRVQPWTVKELDDYLQSIENQE